MNHASIEHATENFSGQRKRLPAKPYRQFQVLPSHPNLSIPEFNHPSLIVLDADSELWRRDDYLDWSHWYQIDAAAEWRAEVARHVRRSRTV